MRAQYRRRGLLVDPITSSRTNLIGEAGDYHTLSVSDARFHLLSRGDTFDPRARRPSQHEEADDAQRPRERQSVGRTS
jgi:hypothetical protein